MARLVNLHAGDLRHAVKILTATRTPDGAGGLPPVWSISYRMRAAVEETKGKEILFGDGTKSAATHVFTMRRGPWINTLSKALAANSHRIEYQGRRLRVIAPPVNVAGEGVYYRLYCTEYGTDQ